LLSIAIISEQTPTVSVVFMGARSIGQEGALVAPWKT